MKARSGRRLRAIALAGPVAVLARLRRSLRQSRHRTALNDHLRTDIGAARADIWRPIRRPAWLD